MRDLKPKGVMKYLLVIYQNKSIKLWNILEISPNITCTKLILDILCSVLKFSLVVVSLCSLRKVHHEITFLLTASH